ncbi:MAG: glucose-inhibited division protein A [Zetaproteobacteria bacterium]|nr:MAG: glucose-inhibited division protein A [Zetaproteobacteria bacterium]
MQVQRLDLSLPVHRTYSSWVRHPGVEEACNRLGMWLIQGGMLWLCSRGVAGKTHLLQMLAADHPALGLCTVSRMDPRAPYVQVNEWAQFLKPYAFWAIDVPAGPVHRASMLALFHLIERARCMGRPLLISWRVAIDATLPAELGSRLVGMLEKVDIAPPPDDEWLRAVMRSICNDLQWVVEDRVLDTILSFLPRQLEVIAPALDHLERLSLAQRRRRLSQAWVRESLAAWLQRDSAQDEGGVQD